MNNSLKGLRGFLASLSQLPASVLGSAMIVISVFLCLVALLARFPGTQVAGVGVNWLLIWVVSWSIKRSVFEGAVAGLALGLIQDGLTAPFPSHALGLALAGVLTALLQKQRYIQEDFISVALIVFGMAVVVETVIAIEISLKIQTQEWLPSVLNVSSTVDSAFTEPANSNAEFKTAVVDRVGFTLPEVWLHHQRVALSSAIVSSLWAPIVYYPLNRWWQWLEGVKQI